MTTWKKRRKEMKMQLLASSLLGGQILVFVQFFGLRSGSACDARRSPRWTNNRRRCTMLSHAALKKELKQKGNIYSYIDIYLYMHPYTILKFKTISSITSRCVYPRFDNTCQFIQKPLQPSFTAMRDKKDPQTAIHVNWEHEHYFANLTVDTSGFTTVFEVESCVPVVCGFLLLFTPFACLILHRDYEIRRRFRTIESTM